MSRSDPPRLVEEPGTLRDLIEGARQDGPTVMRLNAIANSVETEVAKTPARSSGPRGARHAARAKIAVGVVAAAVVAVGLYAWLSKKHAPEQVPPLQPTTTLAPALPAPTENSPPANSEQVPIPVTALPKASRAHAPLARPSAENQSDNEIALLERAQDAVRSDPSRALALADEAGRRFPDGTLAQEREVLAIDALTRLGRTADAKARAEKFREAFPNSAGLQRIDQILAGAR